MAAAANGMFDTPAVFSSRKSLASCRQVGCNLTVVEAREYGCAWFHYKVSNARERWASMAWVPIAQWYTPEMVGESAYIWEGVAAVGYVPLSHAVFRGWLEGGG